MDRTIARRIFVLALFAGLAVDLLVDGFALGLNVLVVAAGLVLAIGLVRPRGTRIDRADLWLPAVSIFAALGPVLRTDPVVVFLDLVVATIATGAWAVAASGRQVTRASTLAVIELGVRTVAALGLGAPSGVRGALADDLAASARARLGSSMPVVRGLILAVPVVFVFLALFVSADAVFASYVDGVFHLPIALDDLIRRTIVVAGVAWLAGGLFAVAANRFAVDAEVATALEPARWGSVDAEPAGPPGNAVATPRARAGATEAFVVLLAVEVLFAAFVASQARYLFGGLEALDEQGGVYSGYAREGYFQLVAAVVLAGLLLAAVEWLAGATTRFIGAALVFVVLTFVVLASAALRLGLYLQAYGWTELRFYVAASIAWLAVGGAILGILIARRRMAWLWHGLAMAGVAITLAISAIGPQAFIADQNLARALDPSLIPADGHPGVDALYLSAFSDDAIPDLVAAYPRLDAQSQRLLSWGLQARKEALEEDVTIRGWPAWNLARERARAALAGWSPPVTAIRPPSGH